MSYDETDKTHFLVLYKADDCRSWPYFPIVMPLLDGNGPATDEECNKITWEVWDQLCNTYGSFDYLPDAINKAIQMNREFLGLHGD